MLFVDPQWIGQGLGSQLLEHASLAARHLGWSAVRIEADPFAAPFYEHMGAVRVGVVRSELIAGRTLPLLRMPLGSG
jgi:GNAT superfamily N-acetyltransferase